MKKALIVSLFIIFFCFANCKTHKEDQDFKKINFDWTKDYIGEIATGLNPNIRFKHWACIKTEITTDKSVFILYKTDNKFNMNNIKLLEKGFIAEGHHSNKYYYIAVIDETKGIYYITDLSHLLEFFGEVDTMEEALMIAKIKGFNVDYDDPRGGSYREFENGFEFLLMKEEENGLYEYRQYFIKVDGNGGLTSEKRKIYCSGYQECYE